MISLCTLFDQNYLSKGIALIRSLQQHHAAAFRLFALALDEATEHAVKALGDERVTVISPILVETAELRRAKETRTREEFCWTLTPFLVSFCLSTFDDVPHVAYVDADCFVTHPLDSLYREVRNAAIAITPHRFSPARAKTHGVNGTYNVGWVYFRNDETARTCLDEWANLCLNWCYRRSEQDAVGNWRMGDQAYWDQLVPKYGAHVVKANGANLGPWAVDRFEYEFKAGAKAVESERLFVIERDAGGGVVRIDNLLLYHFHGLEYDSRRRTFKRGGYALPPPIVEHVYKPYEATLERITRELNHQPA